MALLAAPAIHLPQDPVHGLFNEDGDDIEQGVDAADAHEDEDEVGEAVEALAGIPGVLAADEVPKANGAESHKAEVECVEVAPSFHGGVHGGHAAGDEEGGHAQDQHDIVHGGLPASRAVHLTFPRVIQALLGQGPPPPGLPLVARFHDAGDDGDQALQEEVEEQDGAGAPEEAIEDQKDFSFYCGWSRHPKPCRRHKSEESEGDLCREWGQSWL